MSELKLLIKYQLINIIRTKWLIAYSLFFFSFTSALLMFGSEQGKALASVLSVVLLIVPIINILYSAIYWYNSESFTSLLLTQPLRRSHVFLANWIALSLGMSSSFALSTAVALLINEAFSAGSLIVLIFGSLLSFIFVGLGLLISVVIKSPTKGLGIAFVFWLYFSILHDAFVFSLASSLREYPLEVPTMLLMASNPIDLARVYLLLNLDMSAMMGYTGKVLQDALSSSLGQILVAGALLVWILLPAWVGLRIFRHKDI